MIDSLFNWMIRGIFYFWLGTLGVGLTDMALSLHDQTVAAYKKGPINAAQFTRMLTSDNFEMRHSHASKR